MADEFVNEQTTSFADFMGKLYTFAVTTMGWTGDRDPASFAGEFAISVASLGSNTNDIQVAAGWDTGSPNSLGLYQYNHASGAGNYNTVNLPYGQATDSGNGDATTTEATLATNRNCEIGATPLQYWAFASSTPAKYIYVVVETTLGDFRHFGFGELKKHNDWDGGAFLYGWRKPNESTNNSVAVVSDSYHLLDGYHRGNNLQKYTGTINVENMPGQVASGMWGIVCSPEQFYAHTVGDDRQTVPIARAILQGGYRQGIAASAYAMMPASSITGFVPGYPIEVVYIDTVPTKDDWYGPIGVMDGVRGVNIKEFSAAEDVVIGGVTWMMFPSRRKGTGIDPLGSANQGIMYRKNVV